MSKGSPIIPIRIPEVLLEKMEVIIRQRNERTREQPWTRTGFILSAIVDKLKKMERSRKSGGRKGTASVLRSAGET